MENLFIKLNNDITNKSPISIEDLIGVLKNKDLNAQLRDELNESSLLDKDLLNIIRILKTSPDPKILSLSSLIYTKLKNHEKAFECAFAAYRINQHDSDIKMVYINAAVEQVSKYLEDSDFEKAEILLDEIHTKFKKTDSYITNHLFLLSKMIPIYKSFDLKVLEAKKSIEIQQWKIIEIVGLFSAILAFIITNIQIVTSNLESKEAFVLMTAMASVLIVFAISISYLFSNIENQSFKKDKFISFPKNKKFVALSLSLLILLFLTFYKL